MRRQWRNVRPNANPFPFALPFGHGTGKQLMRINAHFLPMIEQKVNAVTHLPPAWGTLYELTQVSPDTFAAALEEGRRHAGFLSATVRALWPLLTRSVLDVGHLSRHLEKRAQNAPRCAFLWASLSRPNVSKCKQVASGQTSANLSRSRGGVWGGRSGTRLRARRWRRRVS